MAASPPRPAASAPSYFERYIEPAVLAALSPSGGGGSRRNRRDERDVPAPSLLSPQTRLRDGGPPEEQQPAVRRSAALRELAASAPQGPFAHQPSASLASAPRGPDDAGLKARSPHTLRLPLALRWLTARVVY